MPAPIDVEFFNQVRVAIIGNLVAFDIKCRLGPLVTFVQDPRILDIVLTVSYNHCLFHVGYGLWSLWISLHIFHHQN